MRYHPFRQLGLKILALALASLLWLTVAGEHVVERSLRVPLEFRNIPEALEIVGNPPDTVDVRLRGSSAVLSRVQSGEIVAVLDLSTARSGSRLFHIRNDEVRAPFGVEVSQVVPATLALELEKSARRKVPVTPVIDGDPAPGFVVGKYSVDPATVEIVGPDSHVRQVAEATTEPVSVKDARSRVRDNVTIGVVDSSVRLVAGAERQRHGRDLAGARGAPDAERAGAVAESRRRVEGAGLAPARPCDRPRLEGSARGPDATIVSRRSWTLPGSVRAGTISGFRSTPRRTSGWWRLTLPSFR